MSLPEISLRLSGITNQKIIKIEKKNILFLLLQKKSRDNNEKNMCTLEKKSLLA